MWPVRQVDDAAVAALARESRVSGLAARLLWLRGVRDAGSVQRWLNPAIEHLHPPELLPDFEAAVARIRQAVGRRETILLWGHDDLDGITSIVILFRLLTDLRADVRYYVPAKGRERHGLNPEMVAGPGRDGVRLVVTVDCGITNREQVAELKAKGIDVVVTDHHEVPALMPDAVANVDAKRPDSKYPYRGLASAGVALKLGMGIVREALGLSVAEFFSTQPNLLAIAVLGTIADRVPLTGENRTLVALGLRSLETTTIPAIQALTEQLNRRGGGQPPSDGWQSPGSERLTLSRFVAELLPYFAAASGNEAVGKFLSAGKDEARAWVSDLARQSQEWQAEAERSYVMARESVVAGDGIVFVRNRELSLRALGACAARLKDQYQMPAVVMGWRGDAWVGECRGIEGVSLMDLLGSCGRYFIDFGGHRKAAGFSIAEEQVDGFIRCAESYAHEHFAGRIQSENVVYADAMLPVRDFDSGLVALAPFGDGNPQPVFISEPVRLRERDAGWAPDERPELSFRPARREVQLEAGAPVELLYTMDDRARLTVLDVRPPASDAGSPFGSPESGRGVPGRPRIPGVGRPAN
jgi:single-stranded-DNA-specific exonuclease